MFITNFNNGIKFLDLLEITENQNNLYEKINKFLIDLKPYFFIDNDKIWKDFIERFCDKYYSRYLSFDTFYEFKIKLKFLLENNKRKYEQLYRASLIEIKPLINEYIKEVVESKKENNDVYNGENINNTEVKNEINTNSESKSNSNNNSFNVNANSNTPQSNLNIENIIENDNYVDNVQNTKNTDSSLTENYLKDSSINNNVTNGKNNYKNVNKLLEELLHTNTIEKINGNQSELLKIYSEIYIDVINTILADIDNEHLFSDILYY